MHSLNFWIGIVSVVMAVPENEQSEMLTRKMSASEQSFC